MMNGRRRIAVTHWHGPGGGGWFLQWSQRRGMSIDVEPPVFGPFRTKREAEARRRRLVATPAPIASAATLSRVNAPDVRESFMAYRMGWRDAAVGRARRRESFAHRPDLLAEYDRGERDGAEASGAAAHAAAERLGYDLEFAIIDR